MPPSEFLLQLVSGKSRERERVLGERDPAGALLTVGTQGAWCVQDASMSPVHVVFARRGHALFVRAQGGSVAQLNGQAIGSAWVPVPSFAHLAFGGAQLKITSRPVAHGPVPTRDEERTVLGDDDGALLAALLRGQAGEHAADGREEAATQAPLPVADTVVAAEATVAPRVHETPKPQAYLPEPPRSFDPYRTMMLPPTAHTNALPESPVMSMPPSRIAPSVAPPAPGFSTMMSERASMRPLALGGRSNGPPPLPPSAFVSPAGAAPAVHGAHVAYPSPRAFEAAPCPPSRIAPSLAPAGMVTMALPVVPAAPPVDRAVATPSEQSLAPVARSSREPNGKPTADLVQAWKAWPPVRKAAAVCALPAVLILLLGMRAQGARTSTEASAAASTRVAAHEASASSGVTSAPSVSSPSVARVAEPRVEREAALPALAVATTAHASDKAPTPSPRPQQSPPASPPTKAAGHKTPDRSALDAAAEGSFDVAAARYEALAEAHPESPTYREAARILRAKAHRERPR